MAFRRRRRNLVLQRDRQSLFLPWPCSGNRWKAAMTGVSTTQLMLSLEPTVVERWPTLRAFLAHRVTIQAKLAKTIAGDMGLSPGTLSKKLNVDQDSDYANRFNVDDLEGYLASTGDLQAVLEYLATKFEPGGGQARRDRAIATVEALVPELTRALSTLKGGRK